MGFVMLFFFRDDLCCWDGGNVLCLEGEKFFKEFFCFLEWNWVLLSEEFIKIIFFCLIERVFNFGRFVMGFFKVNWEDIIFVWFFEDRVVEEISRFFIDCIFGLELIIEVSDKGFVCFIGIGFVEFFMFFVILEIGFEFFWV